MGKKIIFKCNGKKLEITPLVGEKNGNRVENDNGVVAPGRGEIDISTPALSVESVSSDTLVTCKTTVKGRNIAQISAEVFLQLNKSIIGPVYRSYLHSPADREVKGVLHPHWTEVNEVEFEVNSKLRLIYCGAGFTLACLVPEQFVASEDKQIWSIEGVYQRGGGEPFRAKLIFDDQGSLVKKTGFYPAGTQGLVSPFELFIEDGDTFEPYVTLISETGEECLATAHPIMLNGSDLLHWKQIEAPAVTFRVGVLVEDFDGQTVRKSSALSIKQNLDRA